MGLGSTADVVRARAIVSGRVQGVFFRDTCARKAEARGLTGSVRNLPDGRVEATFQGSREDVEALIEWCRSGPRGAHVRDVEVEWEEPRPGESTFRVTW